MKSFTRSFKKIVPSLRQATMEIVEKQILHGEKIPILMRDQEEVEIFIHHASQTDAGVVFELHGGGFVLGDARKDDAYRQRICDALDVHVIGINYRKAPEYTYPTAIHDVVDVIDHIYKNHHTYRILREKMAIIGFSAGANLAVCAAKELRDMDIPIELLILAYPYLDGYRPPSEKKVHKADLPVEVMEAFTDLYAPDEDLKNPNISPLYEKIEILKQMPKTSIYTAKEDALCEEGEAYFLRLQEAGVDSHYVSVEDMHHGFMEDYFNMECYTMTPEDTKALHSKNMPIRAEETLEDMIEDIKSAFSKS